MLPIQFLFRKLNVYASRVCMVFQRGEERKHLQATRHVQNARICQKFLLAFFSYIAGFFVLLYFLTPYIMKQHPSSVAALNDQLRQNFIGGKVMLSHGIAELEKPLQIGITTGVQAFNHFDMESRVCS